MSSNTKVLSCQALSLQSIDFSLEWNLHPWEFSTIPHKLHESFTLNGIIHPPIVKPADRKSYSIVAGAKRLHFLMKYHSSEPVNCMVLEQKTPFATLLHLILADQNCSSSLSLAEKARFIKLALRELTMEQIISIFNHELQLPKGRAIIRILEQLLQQEQEFITATHEGRIQDKMVGQLLSLADQRDRSALIRIFKDLAMGDGKQKKLFNLIRDIAYREDLSIADYLQQPKITEILQHQEMNIPQKIQNLGNLLQQENSPTASQAEEQFLQEVKSLHLEPNQTLSHSPSFEKDEVTLSITFKNLQDCQEYLQQKMC